MRRATNSVCILLSILYFDCITLEIKLFRSGNDNFKFYNNINSREFRLCVALGNSDSETNYKFSELMSIIRRT